jgi:hypothetical protein
MNLKLTRLHLVEQNKNFSQHFKSGVSLHCHTQHSKEMLDFVPHIAAKLPIISIFWERERQKYLKREGKGIDLSEAYWTPPLAAHKVYDIERQQINEIGLDALVSITDHDDISAGQRVRCEHAQGKDAPISLEWTVPFEEGYFHVGVHNLPENRADELAKDLLDFTFAEKRALKFEENRLNELFEMLNQIPEVLVVLNHPLWDIEMVGEARHKILLDNFIVKHGRWVHAFEINGFRSWSENKAVLEMADQLGFPVVSGGDRHGCQPNSVVNLTTTSSFGEFVEQIKNDKHSQVVLMPHYRQPLGWRQLESFAEILKLYPDYEAERRHWTGRVHVQIDERGLKPLSFFWKKGGPTWLKAATWTLGALGSPIARPVFRIVTPRRDRLPRSFGAPVLTEKEIEQISTSLTSDTV